MRTSVPESSLPVASLPRRLGAILYDALLLCGVLLAATALILPLTGGEAVTRGNPFFSTYVFLVCFFFYAWFWIHGGQTLGMRAWKIRIQQQDGRSITWWQALLRFLLASLWVMPIIYTRKILGLSLGLSLVIGLGFLLLTLLSRLHDRYSETVLILTKTRR
jgi:uncharacterized RDD family membrane protein YckC